ncbi:hypothetical protein BD310DRAFT_922886 [Dichomitus squalens]|uniref:Uncharacterized protein n=1 Tax=Dichomitus squalens TaxID=114155 RepID=A0A4Q9PZX5_9APHY|nr:hypothetical protein BD310DRAFT_922886 [Dichomitus squalens]
MTSRAPGFRGVSPASVVVWQGTARAPAAQQLNARTRSHYGYVRALLGALCTHGWCFRVRPTVSPWIRLCGAAVLVLYSLRTPSL